MNEQHEQQFHKQILEKIKSGQVTMHSRAFWIWRGVLWAIGLGLLAALGIFIASFLLFIIRANGTWDLPQFGLHGVREFLAVFPWLFIPALLLFVWLIQRFMLQYSFAYGRPVLYSASIIIFVIVVGSIAVLGTPLHRQLFQSARQQHLPIAGGLYRFFGNSRPDDFYVGTIAAAASPGNYELLLPDGRSLSVTTDTATQFFSGKKPRAGDCVEIVGNARQNGILAFGIKESDSSTVMGCRGPDPVKSPDMPPLPDMLRP